MGTGPLQHGAAQRHIAAGVRGYDGFDALDDAVFIAAHGNVHDKGVAFGVNQQRFRPAQFDLYRPAKEISRQRGERLYGHIFLAAEPAAYQSVLHLDFIRAQHRHTFMKGLVSGLIGGV